MKQAKQMDRQWSKQFFILDLFSVNIELTGRLLSDNNTHALYDAPSFTAWLWSYTSVSPSVHQHGEEGEKSRYQISSNNL